MAQVMDAKKIKIHKKRADTSSDITSLVRRHHTLGMIKDLRLFYVPQTLMRATKKGCLAPVSRDTSRTSLARRQEVNFTLALFSLESRCFSRRVEGRPLPEGALAIVIYGEALPERSTFLGRSM